VAGGGGQLAGALIALVRVFGHARRDDLVEPGRDGGPQTGGFGRVESQVPGDLLFDAVPGKGCDTGQTLVEHTRQRVDVGAGISGAGGEALRGHVRSGVVGDTEVDQIHEIVTGHQRVGGFDVAVHQPGFMGGIQRGRELLDHCHGPLGAHRPVTFEQTVHVDAVDQRHHQIQLPVIVFPGVMDRDDVRFGQPGGGVGLAAKPFPIPRLVAQLGGQHLDRHVAADHGVVGFVHLAHAALTDQRQQPEAAERHLIHGPAAGQWS
jgi:hypothetical protein